MWRLAMSRAELTKTFSTQQRIVAALAIVALALGLSLAGIAMAKPSETSDSSLRVFAAASLTDVLPAIDDSPTYNFAGSNTLATQIRNGAPADIFLSADTEIPSFLNQLGYVATPINF